MLFRVSFQEPLEGPQSFRQAFGVVQAIGADQPGPVAEPPAQRVVLRSLGGGGGLMETAAELQKQGVGLSQMRPFITAFAEGAEEKAGRDLVERIAGSIPGLDRYRA